MQPSKEREASTEGVTDDLDSLLDDDLAADERGGDADGDSAGSSAATATADDGGRIGVDGRWFSLKSFAVALGAVAVGVFAGGAIPIIGGTIGSIGGVFLAAFLLGVVFSGRRYAELGVAGAAAGAGTAVASVLGVGFLPIGIDYLQQWGLALLAVGGGLGLAVALAGHYFGRDLRAGLTADID